MMDWTETGYMVSFTSAPGIVHAAALTGSILLVSLRSSCAQLIPLFVDQANRVPCSSVVA
jgi:hypothetical protein